MSRHIRHVEPGQLVEVTNRTLQGRLLLRPSPALNEIILGILGWAQAVTGLTIHAFVFLSNHYHLLCSPADAAQLSKFECLLNSRLAREIGRLHKWREKVWSKRFRPITVSDEAAAQIARLLYILSHGCKEGFVATPGDWPGVHCVDALIGGKPLEGALFSRTLEYEANRRGDEFGTRDFATPQTVALTPLPCWQHLSPEDVRQRVTELVRQVEQEARRRQAETGRPCLGAALVCRQDPHQQPMRSKRSPAPRVHAATKAVRRAMTERYRAFVAAYRRAAERLRAGDLTAAFPGGCFPPARGFTRGAPSPGLALA